MTDNPSDDGSIDQPMSEDEALAIRAEIRARKWALQERSLANGKEGQKLFAQNHHAERQAAIANAADFQKMFVRFAFLLNGGAIIALLTLIGTLGGRSEKASMTAIAQFTGKLVLGVEFFLVGLAVAALSTGIAFLAWQFSASTYLHAGHTSNMVSGLPVFGGLDEKQEEQNFNVSDKLSPFFMYSSAILSLTSLAMFVLGSYKTLKAFKFFAILRL